MKCAQGKLKFLLHSDIFFFFILFELQLLVWQLEHGDWFWMGDFGYLTNGVTLLRYPFPPSLSFLFFRTVIQHIERSCSN